MNRRRTMGCCAACGRTRILRARQLCDSCYTMRQRRGTLDDFPLTSGRRPIADTLEEYQFLVSCGVGEKEIMAKLGYTSLSSLRSIIHRAEAAAGGERS